MRKFFQKLKHDCKGAVTVFVALLLVPAVLVSGFGVDIARLYTTRSEIRDANQLAANSALASYDALLQDLYGLFGMMKSDDELAEMMDEYIRVAILGEDWVDNGPGTFALFSGSITEPCTVKAAEGKNLANAEVLRRQIEQYSKFRAPGIIASEILDKLDTFEKIKEDASVIKKKMDIEDRIEEIDKLYSKIYEGIKLVNRARAEEEKIVHTINREIGELESTVESLYQVRTSYTDAMNSEDEELAEDLRRKYEAVFKNLKGIVNGGKRAYSVYMLGGLDDNGEYQYGGIRTVSDKDGIQPSINKAIQALNGYDTNLDLHDNNSLEEMETLGKKADEKKKELAQMVDELENQLNSGKCSEDLREGLAVQTNAEGKTCIEEYRTLLKYQVEPMATAMRNHDQPQLKDMLEFLRNDIGYGEYDPETQQGSLNETFHSLDWMASINTNTDGFQIDLILQNEERSKKDQDLLEDRLAFLRNLDPKSFAVPGKYELFQSKTFDSTKNPEFYEMLKDLYGNPDSDTKKDDIEKGLAKLAGQIQEQFKGLLDYSPLGAYTYSNGAEGGGSGSGSDFGQEGDWSKKGEAKKQTENALNNSLLSKLSNAGNSAAAKMLLLTYDSEMFSCYSTNEGYSGNETAEPTEENMAGIPLGVKVNYYFQSELEYLYNGNLRDAKSNLMAVTNMIFLIRFVMDYTASFTVSDVNKTVDAVKASLSFLGPAAIAIGELVRMIMAMGEGVMDVSRLKDGCKVAFFKNGSNWTFSLSGTLDNIAEGAVGKLGNFTDQAQKNDDTTGLKYKDYMRLFLLLVDGNTLAQRTSRLIELNMTNYRGKMGDLGSREARESAMAAAELFDMSKAVTDFSVTTTVDLRMLFLSMPVVQKGYIGGKIPPHSKQVTVTDYRGY